MSCGVVPALCPLLASDDKTTQLHTLRAVGNLCFDHGIQEHDMSPGTQYDSNIQMAIESRC